MDSGEDRVRARAGGGVAGTSSPWIGRRMGWVGLLVQLYLADEEPFLVSCRCAYLRLKFNLWRRLGEMGLGLDVD